MREAIVLTVVVAVALGIAGCGQRAANEPPPAAPVVAAPVAAAPAPTTPVAPPVAAAPAQAAAVPAVAAPDDIPELPSYPGAERVKREIDASGGEWAREAKIELVSGDGFEKVRAFYLDAIRTNGWQVTGTEEEKDEIGWKLAKGTSVAEIDLDRESFGRVKIKLERKDR